MPAKPGRDPGLIRAALMPIAAQAVNRRGYSDPGRRGRAKGWWVLTSDLSRSPATWV